MGNLVTPRWLSDHLEDDNLVIVDCRAELLDRDYGKRRYEEGHIKNSCFIDLKKDLVGAVEEHGGRSPLPDIYDFKDKLEKIGVSNNTAIVVYDEGKLASAERFWWFLKYLGHNEVYVLDGGINRWIEEGFSTTKEVPFRSRGIFNININNEIIASVDEVKEKLYKQDIAIIDSRAPERYRGEVEPIDKIAGHIPSAKNYEWKNNLNEKLQFKSKEQLEKDFQWLKDYKEIILYCGSGIDGCGNFIAMEEVGLSPKLYLGSWSDWITYEDNPIAKGEE